MNHDPAIRPSIRPDNIQRVPGVGRGPSRQESSAPTTSPSSGEQGITSVESEKAQSPWQASIPLSISKDERLESAEWGWRRALVSWMTSMEPQTIDSSPAQEGPVMARALTTLWSVLDALATTSGMDELKSPITYPSVNVAEDSRIIPFASLSSLPASWPSPLKSAVMKDRFVSAVVEPGVPHTGAGLFFPILPEGPLAEAPQPGVPKQPAIPWKATRHSYEQEHGGTIHRLTLSLSIDNRPVELSVVAAHPTIHVHVATDHPDIRQFCVADAPIRMALNRFGWHLDGWSLSDYSERT